MKDFFEHPFKQSRKIKTTGLSSCSELEEGCCFGFIIEAARVMIAHQSMGDPTYIISKLNHSSYSNNLMWRLFGYQTSLQETWRSHRALLKTSQFYALDPTLTGFADTLKASVTALLQRTNFLYSSITYNGTLGHATMITLGPRSEHQSYRFFDPNYGFSRDLSIEELTAYLQEQTETSKRYHITQLDLYDLHETLTRTAILATGSQKYVPVKLHGESSVGVWNLWWNRQDEKEKERLLTSTDPKENPLFWMRHSEILNHMTKFGVSFNIYTADTKLALLDYHILYNEQTDFIKKMIEYIQQHHHMTFGNPYLAAIAMNNSDIIFLLTQHHIPCDVDSLHEAVKQAQYYNVYLILKENPSLASYAKAAKCSLQTDPQMDHIIEEIGREGRDKEPIDKPPLPYMPKRNFEAWRHWWTSLSEEQKNLATHQPVASLNPLFNLFHYQILEILIDSHVDFTFRSNKDRTALDHLALNPEANQALIDRLKLYTGPPAHHSLAPSTPPTTIMTLNNTTPLTALPAMAYSANR